MFFFLKSVALDSIIHPNDRKHHLEMGGVFVSFCDLMIYKAYALIFVRFCDIISPKIQNL